MKNLYAFLLAPLSLALLSCTTHVTASPREQSAAQVMFDKLITTLNSKDPNTFRAFLKEYSPENIEQRLPRLGALAERGAPFKVIRKGAETATLLKALVENKAGERVTFAISYQAAPALRLGALRIGPPEDIDAPTPKDYSGWTDLHTLTSAIRQDTNSPAMGIAVIKGGDLQTACDGKREISKPEVVEDNEPWSIGSIGKPICSTVIGKLIDLGKLDWNTTIGEALADLPMRSEYKQITIEQVMHHRGGIAADLGMRRPEVLRIVAGATDPMKIRENYAKQILQRPLAAAPGQEFVYSNAGYALLGIIAERKMHTPYEQLVKDYVFKPLNLKNSYTNLDKLPTRRPMGHMPNDQGTLESTDFHGPIEILYAPAGGGMFMSVQDLATFGQAHLVGLQGKDGLLKASTIARLHQGALEQPGGDREYACGWGIERVEGAETMHTHNGSNGTMRAQLAIFPKSDLVVAAFVNCGGETEPSPPLQAVWAIAKRYAAKKD